ASSTFANNSNEVGAHTTRLGFGSDVLKIYWCPITNSEPTLTSYSAIVIALRSIRIVSNLVMYFPIDHLGMNPSFFTLLLTQPPGANKRYFDGICRVRALYSARPNPGDYRMFSPIINFNLWI